MNLTSVVSLENWEKSGVTVLQWSTASIQVAAVFVSIFFYQAWKLLSFLQNICTKPNLVEVKQPAFCYVLKIDNGASPVNLMTCIFLSSGFDVLGTMD